MCKNSSTDLFTKKLKCAHQSFTETKYEYKLSNQHSHIRRLIWFDSQPDSQGKSATHEQINFYLKNCTGHFNLRLNFTASFVFVPVCCCRPHIQGNWEILALAWPQHCGSPVVVWVHLSSVGWGSIACQEQPCRPA